MPKWRLTHELGATSEPEGIAMAKIYIAGPMTGLPGYNYPSFHAAEAALRALGHDVLNPANNPECDSWEGYMRAAIAQVIQAEAIAFLPGAHDSRGARLELAIGSSLGMDVRPIYGWLDNAA